MKKMDGKEALHRVLGVGEGVAVLAKVPCVQALCQLRGGK